MPYCHASYPIKKHILLRTRYFVLFNSIGNSKSNFFLKIACLLKEDIGRYYIIHSDGKQLYSKY